MHLSRFDYDFPEELVAQRPLPERSASRLMVVDPVQASWAHKKFLDIVDYFGPEDLLVFNNAKVIPSRLYGQTQQGRTVEVLLLQQRTADTWNCLVRPANKLASDTLLDFDGSLQGQLRGEREQWTIQFGHLMGKHRGLPLQDIIAAVGLPPLPPYIKRDEPFAEKAQDIARYQTVYASQVGSAAAPTAGFHFTEAIKQQLKERGCELAYVTLHVGRDTFQPVRTQDITQHKMHGESYHLSDVVAAQIARAKQAGRRVTAVGTTTLRVLESALDSVGARCPRPNAGSSRPGEGTSPLQAGDGYTEKFIYPGYRFKVVDRLLTNFHQPKSTLLMLVAAFAGREFILSAYQEAIEKKYRLFSFGDAMLIVSREIRSHKR